MNRRSFLQLLATSIPALSCSTKLYAAPATDSRFLLVFLRGGYDATNILIPYSSQFYYEARPNIAIAKPDPNNQLAALAINTDWALHPALKTSIWPLFQRGQAAFIPFAGTDDLTRSHFETQDSIELGQPLTGHKNYNSGFINRLVAELSGAPGIAFTDTLPLSCKGSANIANIAFKGANKQIFADRQSTILAEMYRGSTFNEYIKEGFKLRQEVTEDLATEMVQASRGAILAKGFAQQAQRMALMMKDKFNIGFVDVGGWDTHFNQGGAEGQLAHKMADLGDGLAIFAKEMGPQWHKTVVLVISEFGRTFRENGNNGTDHGHGSVYWVLGGGIKGGRIAGEQMQMTADKLFQDRDYPVLNEYRGLMSGLFQSQFGLSDKSLQNIFPTIKPTNLRLM